VKVSLANDQVFVQEEAKEKVAIPIQLLTHVSKIQQHLISSSKQRYYSFTISSSLFEDLTLGFPESNTAIAWKTYIKQEYKRAKE
jgi:hypothetical protein